MISTLSFIGAMLGSALFMFAGREPARRAAAYLRAQIRKAPR